MVQVPTLCTRCQKRLGPQVIRAEKMQFHPQCFVCEHCKKPLEKQFIPKAQHLYHAACYEKLFVPKCNHCQQPIQGAYSKDASGRYHSDCYIQLHNLVCSLCQQNLSGSFIYDHWGNKAHPEHQGESTGQCHVCARLISSQYLAGGRELSDGRFVCGSCHQSEIISFQQIQQAKLDVIHLMHTAGFDYIPDYIKIEFSPDQQLLNQRMQASATGNIHGLTRTTRRNLPNYGEFMEHQISVVNGLPRIAFMGVLAHELLHVWIHENNLNHLSHAQVEGFCNLGTALMYQSEDSELSAVLQQRMNEDPDPAYGDGYRAMAWHLQQLGWPVLLQTLKDSSKALPEPPAEIMPAHPRSEKVIMKPTAPKASQQMSEAQTRLQALKEKLQTTGSTGSHQPSSTGQKENTASSTKQISKPEVSNEISEKVRQRFAQAQQTPNKPKQAGNSHSKGLGKLKRPK